MFTNGSTAWTARKLRVALRFFLHVTGFSFWLRRLSRQPAKLEKVAAFCRRPSRVSFLWGNCEAYEQH